MSEEGKKRFTFRSAVFLVLRDGNKVLLGKRISEHENGNYGLVCGHLDGEETAEQGIVREAKEEAGIDIDPKDLRVLHVMHANIRDGAGEYFNVYLTTDSWKGEITNMELDKCESLDWFDRNNLPENTIKYVRQALDCIDKGIFYSNFGF